MSNAAKARTLLIALGVVATLFATGCARKSTETAPTTPPAPPQETTPTPPTQAPPPAETPPSTPSTPAEALQIQDVFFAYDSATLDEAAQNTLDRNARVLRDKSSMTLVIEGHCDERGTVKYNLDLGEKRAASVRDYLVSAGVVESRLRTISYGKERPFSEGSDESAWAQNRRAHFVSQ